MFKANQSLSPIGEMDLLKMVMVVGMKVVHGFYHMDLLQQS
jgi:hypothetical protein